mmetsp:Transcript_76483/g.127448  ORF Transcript_76483/g.127448 Transcript_76483/m.127448 type:complete len:99 (-) Transcript_76483:408-704(-)
MQSLMGSLEQSSEAERHAMLEKLEEMQVKDTLRMFNGLVERCFSECINGFRSKILSDPEDKCITTCANKFLKHSARVGQRFGELSMQQQQQQQGGGPS